jgi:hypothetical protein
MDLRIGPKAASGARREPLKGGPLSPLPDANLLRIRSRAYEVGIIHLTETAVCHKRHAAV